MTRTRRTVTPPQRVAHQGNPDALLQHLAHRGQTGAKAEEGPGTTGKHHRGPAKGGALAGVGMYTVGHGGVVRPKADVVKGHTIMGAVPSAVP
jgi:hypothetical protein